MSDEHPENEHGGPKKGTSENAYRPQATGHHGPGEQADGGCKPWTWMDMAAVIIQAALLGMTILIAVIYYGQWATMNETMVSSQRAWVLFDEYATPRPIFDLGRIFELHFRNAGASPAQDVTINVGWYLGGEDDDISDVFDEILAQFPAKGRGVIGPDQVVLSALRLWPKQVGSILMGTRNENKVFYVFGAVEYRDIFGYDRSGQFCARFPGAGVATTRDMDLIDAGKITLSPCESHNWAN